MKNAVVREQETIAFIRTATVPAHGNYRELVADLLQNKYPIDNATSIGMSQGSNHTIIGRGAVQTNRHYRRACIAIRAAILGQAVGVAALAVNAILDGALPAAAMIKRLRERHTALAVFAAGFLIRVAFIHLHPIIFGGDSHQAQRCHVIVPLPAIGSFIGPMPQQSRLAPSRPKARP